MSFALPPSHLGHSSKLDGSRFGVGSNKFDSALAALSVELRSSSVATRHSSSKLDSALAAPSVELRSSSVATRQSSNKFGSALAAPSVFTVFLGCTAGAAGCLWFQARNGYACINRACLKLQTNARWEHAVQTRVL